MSSAGIVKGTSVEGMNIIASIHSINEGISLPRSNDIDRINENVPNILDEQTQT
jgi:hypothetical protein